MESIEKLNFGLFANPDELESFLYSMNSRNFQRRKIYESLKTFYNQEKYIYAAKYNLNFRHETIEPKNLEISLIIKDENDLRYFIKYFFSTDLRWSVSDDTHFDTYRLDDEERKPFLYFILKEAFNKIKNNDRSRVVIYLRNDLGRRGYGDFDIKFYWSDEDRDVIRIIEDGLSFPYYFIESPDVLLYLKMEDFFKGFEDKYPSMKNTRKKKNVKKIKKYKI